MAYSFGFTWFGWMASCFLAGNVFKEHELYFRDDVGPGVKSMEAGLADFRQEAVAKLHDLEEIQRERQDMAQEIERLQKALQESQVALAEERQKSKFQMALLEERQKTTFVTAIICLSCIAGCSMFVFFCSFPDKRCTSQDDPRLVYEPTRRRKLSLQNGPDKSEVEDCLEDAITQGKVQAMNRELQMFLGKKRASWFQIHTPAEQSPRPSVRELHASRSTHLLQSPRQSLGN
mmetsp:Transcript_14466/g.25457  ORF Transcript_14466/g.25457 Transcript_14466/m.25457 type:complete len:233 (-) Transcript_14466:198-896(-)